MSKSSKTQRAEKPQVTLCWELDFRNLFKKKTNYTL